MDDGTGGALRQWVLFAVGIGMLVYGVFLTREGSPPSEWYWAAALAATGIGNEIAKHIGRNGGGGG